MTHIGTTTTWSTTSSATHNELNELTNVGNALDELPEDPERLSYFMSAFLERGEELVRIVDDELAAPSDVMGSDLAGYTRLGRDWQTDHAIKHDAWKHWLRTGLSRRAKVFIALGFVVSLLYACVTSQPVQQEKGFVDPLLAYSLPYICLVTTAAYLPKGIPPWSTKYFVLIWLLTALADVNNCVAAAQNAAFPPAVRTIRAVNSGCWALNHCLLSLDIVRTCGQRWWASVRVSFSVSIMIRLFCLALLFLDGTSSGYPPRNMTLSVSLAYNFACLAVMTVGLSPSSRNVVAQWTGGAQVVINLSDALAELPIPVRDGRSLDTLIEQTIASTRRCKNSSSGSSCGLELLQPAQPARAPSGGAYTPASIQSGGSSQRSRPRQQARGQQRRR